MSKASWALLEAELVSLLTGRRISKETAVAVAGAVCDACGGYLNQRRFAGPEYRFKSGEEVIRELRAFLTNAATLSTELRELLEGSSGFTGFASRMLKFDGS